MPSNLRIDPERLWSTLMETAAIGGTAKGGINRQTLTAEDAQVAVEFTACRLRVEVAAERDRGEPRLPSGTQGKHVADLIHRHPTAQGGQLLRRSSHRFVRPPCRRRNPARQVRHRHLAAVSAPIHSSIPLYTLLERLPHL